MKPADDLFPSSSLPFVEELYDQFLHDPESVSPDWRDLFEQLRDKKADVRKNGHPAFFKPTRPEPAPKTLTQPTAAKSETALQERVDLLIQNYRIHGHLAAQIDPLGKPRPHPPELDPAFYGFTAADMTREFSTQDLPGKNLRTLHSILQQLRNTYCRSIGVEFMHIINLTMRKWLQERMEQTENRTPLSRESQLQILTRLTDAVLFEEFVKKRFLGAKSFSLEGGETLIPLLELVIETVGGQGVQEIVLGMAHRGRLNVLANILRKSPKLIFREFEDDDATLFIGRGDVKYHLGHSTDWTTASGHKIHLSLCFNPSHLEFVNSVVLGRVRAKQDRTRDLDRQRGVAVLIHGDAAFAGEGITQETLNLSELPAYTIGGAVHIIVNNQIGFTTPPEEAHSSVYATGVAKMLQAPIFHVNGEDPEAVAQVVRLGLEFRQMFCRDLFIDMYCFRRHGHNETDEPAFTQPMLYQSIAKKPSVRESYLKHLLELRAISRDEADHIARQRQENLEKELEKARHSEKDKLARHNPPLGLWKDYFGGPVSRADRVETGVPAEQLANLLNKLTAVPEGFHLHPRLQKVMQDRRDMAAGSKPLDWGAAEALAFAALAVQGIRVRLSGQDSGRGTFSHRHALLYDTKDGKRYTPLQHVREGQAPVEVINSPLSEQGVLGFEYGYSLDYPDALVLWEAQFGDFHNAGQVIIDQFITSAEDKWSRLSGLVMLLPHAFDGQGPEHSSARLERFLTLAAEDNIQVVYPTTPAQCFHLLRRQGLRKWRKPLVVLTPKGLLRHKEATSTLHELSLGRFHAVLDDKRTKAPQEIRRILLCSGKIYYELDQFRTDHHRHDVAILRLEELYPFPRQELQAALQPYRAGTPVYWVQEEPENMGAWRYLRALAGEQLFDSYPFSLVARPESASPATGSHASHDMEQEALLFNALEKTTRKRGKS